MHKPTEQIINENEYFFNNLSNVEKIYVYGHSISQVDILYFEKLFKSVNDNCKWCVSYHNSASIRSLKDSLLNIGLSENKIEFIKLTEIQINYFQLKLDI